jgi:hypothetical protein
MYMMPGPSSDGEFNPTHAHDMPVVGSITWDLNIPKGIIHYTLSTPKMYLHGYVCGMGIPPKNGCQE